MRASYATSRHGNVSVPATRHAIDEPPFMTPAARAKEIRYAQASKAATATKKTTTPTPPDGVLGWYERMAPVFKHTGEGKVWLAFLEKWEPDYKHNKEAYGKACAVALDPDNHNAERADRERVRLYVAHMQLLHELVVACKVLTNDDKESEWIFDATSSTFRAKTKAGFEAYLDFLSKRSNTRDINATVGAPVDVTTERRGILGGNRDDTSDEQHSKPTMSRAQRLTMRYEETQRLLVASGASVSSASPSTNVSRRAASPSRVQMPEGSFIPETSAPSHESSLPSAGATWHMSAPAPAADAPRPRTQTSHTGSSVHSVPSRNEPAADGATSKWASLIKKWTLVAVCLAIETAVCIISNEVAERLGGPTHTPGAAEDSGWLAHSAVIGATAMVEFGVSLRCAYYARKWKADAAKATVEQIEALTRTKQVYVRNPSDGYDRGMPADSEAMQSFHEFRLHAPEQAEACIVAFESAFDVDNVWLSAGRLLGVSSFVPTIATRMFRFGGEFGSFTQSTGALRLAGMLYAAHPDGIHALLASARDFGARHTTAVTALAMGLVSGGQGYLASNHARQRNAAMVAATEDNRLRAEFSETQLGGLLAVVDTVNDATRAAYTQALGEAGELVALSSAPPAARNVTSRGLDEAIALATANVKASGGWISGPSSAVFYGELVRFRTTALHAEQIDVDAEARKIATTGKENTDTLAAVGECLSASLSTVTTRLADALATASLAVGAATAPLAMCAAPTTTAAALAVCAASSAPTASLAVGAAAAAAAAPPNVTAVLLAYEAAATVRAIELVDIAKAISASDPTLGALRSGAGLLYNGLKGVLPTLAARLLALSMKQSVVQLSHLRYDIAVRDLLERAIGVKGITSEHVRRHAGVYTGAGTGADLTPAQLNAFLGTFARQDTENGPTPLDTLNSFVQQFATSTNMATAFRGEVDHAWFESVAALQAAFPSIARTVRVGESLETSSSSSSSSSSSPAEPDIAEGLWFEGMLNFALAVRIRKREYAAVAADKAQREADARELVERQMQGELDARVRDQLQVGGGGGRQRYPQNTPSRRNYQ
jgi:hypothetical protein